MPQDQDNKDETLRGTAAETTGSRSGRPGPTDRAFVVQIAPDCDASGDGLSGRVQHLATSDGGNFRSVDGLVAIVRRVLERS